jgi:hypothetical protein
MTGSLNPDDVMAALSLQIVSEAKGTSINFLPLTNLNFDHELLFRIEWGF